MRRFCYSFLILFFSSLGLLFYFFYLEEVKSISFTFLDYFYKITIPYFVVANSFYLLILLCGFIKSRKKYFDQVTHITHRLASLKSLKPISVLVPCYNEEATIEASLSATLRLDYPDYEVVVCNDGSTDKTMEILHREFALEEIKVLPPNTIPSQRVKAVYRSRKYENLTVINKDNGGKADALNASINFSQYPLICCVDSDGIIDGRGLINISLPFLESEKVIATGGTVLISNPEKEKTLKERFTHVNTTVPNTWIGMIQVVEYLRAFFVGRQGWSYINSNAIISGAFGLFKKSMVIRAGGYETKTIGEDMELLLRMQSYCLSQSEEFEVNLLPTPVCWTEAPSDLKSLGNQRARWSQGLVDCLWRHKSMLFSPSTKMIGMVGLPYFLLFEVIAALLKL